MGDHAPVLVVGLNYGPEPTGIAPYTEGLASGLAERGYRVRVISGFAHYPQWEFSPPNPPRTAAEIRGGVFVTRIRHRLPRSATGLSRLISELTFGVRALFSRWGKPRTVIAVSPALFASLLVMLRARLSRQKAILWIQDMYGLGSSETQSVGLLGRIVIRVSELICLHLASDVVVIHDRFLHEVCSTYAVSPLKLWVIRNWSHLDALSGVNRQAGRSGFGWLDDEIIALHSGNIGLKQGLENLVSAGKIAQERGSRVRFIIVGDGNQRGVIEKASRGIENVTVMGPLPSDLFEKALQSADVLVVNERPGISGMAVPSKLTSYFAAGRPVVAATDPGSVTESEVLASGGGVVVQAGDPARLLDTIEALADDQDKSESLAMAGLAFREAELSQAAAISRFIEIID